MHVQTKLGTSLITALLSSGYKRRGGTSPHFDKVGEPTIDVSAVKFEPQSGTFGGHETHTAYRASLPGHMFARAASVDEPVTLWSRDAAIVDAARLLKSLDYKITDSTGVVIEVTGDGTTSAT